MDSTQGGSLASILYKVSLIGVNKFTKGFTKKRLRNCNMRGRVSVRNHGDRQIGQRSPVGPLVISGRQSRPNTWPQVRTRAAGWSSSYGPQPRRVSICIILHYQVVRTPNAFVIVELILVASANDIKHEESCSRDSEDLGEHDCSGPRNWSKLR